ncbi:hypothetical protein AVEN_222530-1 [Araneus ventricosus]|uniref:Transposase domain-containing protein n=1 Tax=Araneus ventricosus TaxID=182803 RepID=A0A4Y2H021_ARAVE|nr:hypothetical protein AVEN_222530-1 [Araneus ventricosus]
MADRIYKKRGTYNRFLRTDEPIPKSTFYSKRKLSESQHADDTDDNTSISAFCDAEEKFSCETSPHIDEDIHFNDLEFDCFNVDSTDCEDNDTYQNDDVKVNLANLNEPLYPSSSVSLLDAYISILAFSLRHNITKTCMQDLLQLFNVLLPPSNLPGTKHLFYSKLSSLFDNSTQAYIYCKYCFETVCFLSDKHKSDICKECLKSFDFQDSMKQGYFFMYMPLEPQLKLKFQYQNLMHNIKKYKRIFEEPSSSYRDILDGEAYAKIKNLKYSDNISLQFNIDGIPMYRKSNYQIWPIQCMINELPPNERKDHILMRGLWFGPHKPNMNVFLKPFVTELSNLSRSGFKWIDATNSKQIVTKVFPIICSSDAPARAAVQNFIQYNGKYGCGFCQHSGERVEKGKGHLKDFRQEYERSRLQPNKQATTFGIGTQKNKLELERMS